MKRLSFITMAFLLLFSLCMGSFAADTQGISPSEKNTSEWLLKDVTHLKQSTVRMVSEGKVIYVDPVWIENASQDADLILITHTHSDHYSMNDIKNLLKPGATLVVPENGVAAASAAGIKNIVSVSPKKEYKVDGIEFKTVPAYNLNKNYHPEANNWVGYIIHTNKAKYYFAGDTDFIPEMKSIEADVAFLPVGGKYTMDTMEAIEAANTIKPIIAVPVHFADVVGSTDDAQTFVRGLDDGIEGVVLKDLLAGASQMTQSTIRLKSKKIIYFDPINIADEPKDADIIFITHSHSDHFSIANIKKLAKPDTILVLPGNCVKTAQDNGFTNIVQVEPSVSYEAGGVKFATVPAYNVNKSYHKPESKWVGYIVYINNTSYYFAGDTDIIPEMNNIKANVVFLPVAGKYTMDAREASEAANLINPLVAVPIHYGYVVGSIEDAKTFINGLNSTIKGVILKQE